MTRIRYKPKTNIIGRPPSKKTVEDYRNFILKNIVVDEETKCWNWSMARDDNGYGLLRWFTKQTYTHRVSYWRLRMKTL